MRILLTGASGFIGRHLLQALLAEGHHVVCAVRRPRSSTESGNSARLATIHADFTQDTDKSFWLARLNQPGGIFRETGSQTFARLHSEAPRALFADRAAATRYHLSKEAADDYLASLPVRAYIVQPSLVYGSEGPAPGCSAPWPACRSRCASAARPSWHSRSTSTTWRRPSPACSSTACRCRPLTRLMAKFGRVLPGGLRDIAQEAARTGTEITPQYWRYFRIWVTLGVPAFIAFVVIFWPMLATPM